MAVWGGLCDVSRRAFHAVNRTVTEFVVAKSLLRSELEGAKSVARLTELSHTYQTLKHADDDSRIRATVLRRS